MIYNPLDKFYKSQTGAVSADKLITFRVKGNFDSVIFVLHKDGENFDSRYSMQKKGDIFELDITFNVGLYYYRFDLCNGKTIGLGNNYLGEILDYISDFQLTVYDANYSVPEWFYGGIIYQIFPDRFYRAEKEKNIPEYKVLHDNWNDTPVYEPNEYGKILNNDFFGGDLKGIIEKLDYINSLGVTVIYLNPIFKAYSNHRYDTGNYMEIDPLLGSIDEFKQLINKASALGIKIILDGVFNHTGDDSLYFNKYNRYPTVGAYQSKDSKYYSWYNFTKYPDKYDSWWGIETLPAINEQNEDYINYITGKNGVLDYYTKLGIGGWRLDVVDELPSSFVKKVRSAVKNASYSAIVIGEVWEDASNKISYGARREYLQGNELDSVMNYPLKEAIISFIKDGNFKNLSNTIKEQLDHYPHKTLHALMNLLSTHDTARLITVLSGIEPHGATKKQLAETFIPEDKIEQVKFKLKCASLLQFTLCGVPSIYYGDEIGMQGYADPLNRRTYPWGKEDLDLLSWYKFLGELRAKYSSFTQGEFVEIFADIGVYVFKRADENSEVLIAVNISENEYQFQFDSVLTELVTNTENKDFYNLTAKSCAVLVKNK